MIRPSRDEFRALAAQYTVVPVWRELLADLTTPVAAFARVVGDEPGFLLESVEHAERWGRWSFVGRRPTATLIVRATAGSRSTGVLPGRCRSTAGSWPRSRASCAAYRSPALEGLPPLHGGVVGYLGYDVVREVERLPDVPPDDAASPTPSCRSSASWPSTTTGASG